MSVRRSTLAVLVSLCAGALAVPSVAASAEQCPNAAFRTGSSAHLPDCRAYELVTPPFKNLGNPLMVTRSANGLVLGITLNGGTPELEGYEGSTSSAVAHYTVERTASGWKTTADNLPRPEYQAFKEFGESGSNDFLQVAQGGAETFWAERKEGGPENSLNIFARLPNRSVVEVGPVVPPTTPPAQLREIAISTNLEVPRASVDGSHILFYSFAYRWPFDETSAPFSPYGASAEYESLYEYAGTGNTTPMLVGVNNQGKVISNCGAALGSVRNIFGGGIEPFSEINTHNAMSVPNGRTIFFTARCGVSTMHELYARLDNGEPGARTVDISEPSKEDCTACETEATVAKAAIFEGASEDGSKVFFVTEQPLLEGATGWNLYEYDFDAPTGERVTRVPAGELLIEPPDELPYRPLIAEDGSHVYFISKSALTATPNGVGETAEAGGLNVYAYERDASYPSGRTEFVARLSERDVNLWHNEGRGPDVTPNGDFLVFASERDLTPDAASVARQQQLYEYDAQTGALVRVSIGEDGFNSNGNVDPNASLAADASARLGPGPFYGRDSDAEEYWDTQSVSADGSYVFFESAAGLTPQALNLKPTGVAYYRCSFELGGDVGCPEEEQDIQFRFYANNIYEYHNGHVYLISDGQDIAHDTNSRGEGDPTGSEVQLLGTDESGDDVLFATTDQLVKQDIDTNVDYYDARIDGGFPAPAVPQSCAGESCQGALSGAPTLLSPGSEFQAGGNPPLKGETGKPTAKSTQPKSTQQCKRGYVKKQGKCVRSKAKKTKAKKAKKASNKRRVKS